MGIEVTPTGTACEHCAIKRSAFAFKAAVRERGRSAQSVRIVDFSAQGCRLDGAMLLATGQQIWIRLPGLEALSAQVMWCDYDVAGIAFDKPLHPAVARRFVPAQVEEVSTANGAGALADRGPVDPLLSRREQIMQGVAANDHSPLKSRKQPTGRGMLGMIARHCTRTVDDRRDMRFKEFTQAGALTVTIDGVRAEVLDISSRGLRATVNLAAGIGALITVEVAGFAPIRGSLIWQCDNDVGLSLPDDSFDLHAA